MSDIDKLISDIVAARDAISEHNQAIEELQTAKAALEAQLMQAMRELNVTQLGSPHGTASVKVKQTPVISDWASLSEYILASGNMQLLQRRLGATSYKELIDSGETVPGVDVFEQDTVSIRRK